MTDEWASQLLDGQPLRVGRSGSPEPEYGLISRDGESFVVDGTTVGGTYRYLTARGITADGWGPVGATAEVL